MNKLFTKIVGVALGLTLAVGVGVAVGSNSEKADLMLKENKKLAISRYEYYEKLGSNS